MNKNRGLEWKNKLILKRFMGFARMGKGRRRDTRFAPVRGAGVHGAVWRRDCPIVVVWIKIKFYNVFFACFDVKIAGFGQF
jgi:hypothetical protein